MKRLYVFKVLMILEIEDNLSSCSLREFCHQLISFFAHLYYIDFPEYCQIFFYKRVNKIPNPMPSRIIAVINRVLIFKGLK